MDGVDALDLLTCFSLNDSIKDALRNFTAKLGPITCIFLIGSQRPDHGHAISNLHSHPNPSWSSSPAPNSSASFSQATSTHLVSTRLSGPLQWAQLITLSHVGTYFLQLLSSQLICHPGSVRSRHHSFPGRGSLNSCTTRNSRSSSSSFVGHFDHSRHQWISHQQSLFYHSGRL